MNESDSKIKLVKVTNENLENGMKVKIVPTVEMIRYVINAMVENWLTGTVTKGKDDKFYIITGIQLVSDAKDMIENEEVFKDFEYENIEEQEN